MSLYHESASILDESVKSGTSLKTIVFTKKTWKSDAKTLFALTSEAAKWSEVLSEVIEKSGILKIERQLSPRLALVLTHDLLLSKKGIALPAKHGLNANISRHKARLNAELTKARIRRGFPSIEALREDVTERANQPAVTEDGATGQAKFQHPRWIRINTIRTTLEEQLNSTFSDFERVNSVKALFSKREAGAKHALCIDQNIPNLLAVSPSANLTSNQAYKQGKLIFQDKASCFPAYLLAPTAPDGNLIDATAAPGNKTTHLAAIVHELSKPGKTAPSRVIACEKDALRSKTLEKMVKIAGASGIIAVKASQNFVLLNPNAKEFENVTALLLDPSCSGSGIVGRAEGGVTVHLPKLEADNNSQQTKKGKKRKRSAPPSEAPPSAAPEEEPLIEEETAPEPTNSAAAFSTRLSALSDFQLRIILHAMKFPSAKRITYSTCSLHAEENEQVVIRALLSEVGREGNWRIMRREEQVEGLRKWDRRGDLEATREFWRESGQGGRIGMAVEVAEGCIRCEKGSEEGTMGFFVAGFVRDGSGGGEGGLLRMDERVEAGEEEEEEEEEEWAGFD